MTGNQYTMSLFKKWQYNGPKECKQKLFENELERGPHWHTFKIQ